MRLVAMQIDRDARVVGRAHAVVALGSKRDRRGLVVVVLCARDRRELDRRRSRADGWTVDVESERSKGSSARFVVV